MASTTGPQLVKATLTQLSTLETMDVLWNPQTYRVARTSRFAAPRVPGSGLNPIQSIAGGEERFGARLFLDSTECEGAARDLRQWVGRLEGWGEPELASGLPPRVLFHWGSFRFRGYIEELREEWFAFDSDGTPVRAWIDLILRKYSVQGK